jgi:hypothetical protein
MENFVYMQMRCLQEAHKLRLREPSQCNNHKKLSDMYTSTPIC